MPTSSLVHADLPLGARMLRDELGADVRRVLVDDPQEFARLRQFAAAFMPEAVERIELYGGARPLFELHGVEAEINRALDRQVQLQSGGYIVIDQTESMTTIDVNTGGFVGNRNPEETVFRTNLEAAVAIARQLRLRNLGGIIIIDFIDMEDDGASRAAAGGLASGAGSGPRPDTDRRGRAAGTGRHDAQAHPREPRAPAVRALPDLRGPRLRAQRRDRLPRHLPRGTAAERPVPGAASW